MKPTTTIFYDKRTICSLLPVHENGHHPHNKTGCLAQSVTCLTADPGVASLIPAWSHTFVEINHEIISLAIFHLSADSKRAVVSYKQKYVHEALVNCLVKLALEKSVVR